MKKTALWPRFLRFTSLCKGDCYKPISLASMPKSLTLLITWLLLVMTGETGKVYGLDMTEAMQDRLAANAEILGSKNVEVLNGNAEDIPLGDATIDVVISNGVLNLVPDKPRGFAEIYRILKPGGRIQLADIVVNESADDLDEAKDNPRLWAECIVGAVHEKTYLEVLRETGFKDVTVYCYQDYFSRSSNDSTRKVAEYFSARSITLSGNKPD